MTTYTLPAFLISSNSLGIPTGLVMGNVQIVAPDTTTSFTYTVNSVENFDNLGFTNVVTLDHNIYSKTVGSSGENVRDTNYTAIFDVNWGGSNQTTLMIVSVSETLRAGVVLGGAAIPVFASLSDYYDWVDTFNNLIPTDGGSLAPGQTIDFASLPGVDISQNDMIVGTDGIDTASFGGPADSYTISVSNTGVMVEDRRADGIGTGIDSLQSIERLQFSGGTAPFSENILDLDQFNGLIELQSGQIDSVIELYIAYFGRAPDAFGLYFWGNAFADGVTLSEMATLFIDQDETRALYPESLTNADFVTSVYNNVLGRVPDQIGFDFWISILNSDAVGRDHFILAVLGGAKADTPSGSASEFINQQLQDQAFLANKTEIGAYYAINRGMSDVDHASDVMSLFDGTLQSFNAAVEAVDSYYFADLDPDSGAFLMTLVGVSQDPTYQIV